MDIADVRRTARVVYDRKDVLWLLLWLGGIAAVGIWDVAFLNRPALRMLWSGFLNTVLISLLVIAFSLVLSWTAAVALYRLEHLKRQEPYLVVTFLLNLLRSIPQIVGILFSYILLTTLVQQGAVTRTPAVIAILAMIITVFVFLEMVDLIRERIRYFRERDFYDAMLVCGISEMRIINREILWKNSLAHIFNKQISLFGVTVFLLCSVDFIVSVGLSTDVSTVNLPSTLGNLLARIDSKQDILAIGSALTNPGYIDDLFFQHLQGLSTAFLIVFTLICIYKIANGFAARHEL